MRLKIQKCLAFLTVGRGEPSAADQVGTESPLAKRETQSPATGGSYRRPRNSIEPPCTDPYARWCGRGGAARLPPIPLSVQKGALVGRRSRGIGDDPQQDHERNHAYRNRCRWDLRATGLAAEGLRA